MCLWGYYIISVADGRALACSLLEEQVEHVPAYILLCIQPNHVD